MEMNSSGFNVSTIFFDPAISELLPALLHYISALYRPIQSPMTALSYSSETEDVPPASLHAESLQRS